MNNPTCTAAVLTAAGLVTSAYAQRAPAPPLTDEVVVSASATPIDAHKAGSAISVVTADDLERRGHAYLAESLRYVPGVTVTRSGSFGGQTQLRLRGSEANHVLVLIDGVEVAGGGVGEFDLSSLLSGGIERLEVIRGPQSGLYGSNAMAGAVNIVTRSGAGQPALGLSVEAGSFATTQLGVDASGGSQSRSGAVSIGYRETDGIDASPVGSERDGNRILTLTGRGRLDVNERLTLDGGIRFADKASDTDGFDFSGGPHQGLAVDSDDWSNTTDAHVTARATWAVDDGRWVTQVSGAWFGGELEGGVMPFGSKTTREQLRVQSTLELGGRGGPLSHTLTGFGDAKEERYRNTVPGDPSQVPAQSRGLVGLGAEYRLDVGERFFLSAVLRRDDNDGFRNATTERLTAVYALRDAPVRVHGSYGTGVTNPTFFEQFGFIPGTFVGNPDLQPERMEGWDLGVELAPGGGQTTVDVTLFDMRLEDEIVNLFPSVINDTGSSRREGVELTLDSRLGQRLSLGATFTYTDAAGPDGSAEVRRPKRMASVDVGWRGAGERARASFGIVHNGATVDDDFRNFFANGFMASKSRLDAYTLVDVSGGYDVSERIELFGRIENTLDTDYVSVIGYATPGRAVYAGVRLRLGR